MSFTSEDILSGLIDQNCALLLQVIPLLQALSNEQYASPKPPIFTSSIGSHLRHALDHYDSVFNSVLEGKVDYHSRQRDSGTELDKDTAQRRVGETTARLRALDATGPLRLRISVEDPEKTIPTSIERELTFSISHTIHHFAFIALICGSFEVGVPENFGLAPSTIAHRKSVAEKA